MRASNSFRFLAIGVLSACTSIQVVQPKDLTFPNPRVRVWVTQSDQTVVVLDSAEIRGDSVFGLVGTERRSMALGEGTVLRAREPSESRTKLLLILCGAGVAAITLYAAHHRFLDSSP